MRLETGCGTLGPVVHEFYPVNIEERRVESVETAGLLFLFSVFMCTLPVVEKVILAWWLFPKI